MDNTPKLVCAECGKEIEYSYWMCYDNFIQAKYFDTVKQNVFCSEKCLHESMSIEEVFLDDEDDICD